MLSRQLGESYLSTTRTSGVLEKELLPEVVYNNIERTTTFDIGSVYRLKKYIRKNNIQIVHAHTTSYFFAVLTKLTLPRLKIVWHDHQGNRDEIKAINQLPLILSSLLFNGVITVNQRLKMWAEKYLYCKNVIHIDNFVANKSVDVRETELFGSDGKRIIKVANLKPPKNHLHLFKAFKAVKKKHPDWSLHIVGKDYDDNYSKELFHFIKNNKLEDSVFIYGLRNDIKQILKQCQIGVIASTYEGLPMALLEYGNAGLSIVTSDVGSCKDLVTSRGIVIAVNDKAALTDAFCSLIEDSSLRKDYAIKIKEYIDANFSENAITNAIFSLYKQLH